MEIMNLLILKTVTHLILIDYYPILKKKTESKSINMLVYQTLAFTIPERILKNNRKLIKLKY